MDANKRILSENENCVICGRSLDSIAVRYNSAIPVCNRCQRHRYKALADATSMHLALFYCCIAFDVPYEVNAVPTKKLTEEAWGIYCNNLKSLNLSKFRDGTIKTFIDGMPDVTRAFGYKLDLNGLNDAVNEEKVSIPKIPVAEELPAEKEIMLPGTEEQREVWGTGEDETHRYSTEDLDNLDRHYKTYAARTTYPDELQEETFRICAVLKLKMKKALAKDDHKAAKEYNAMIMSNLEAESLRRKDSKPIEDVRADSIVDRLEKAGLMVDGKPQSPDIIFEKMFGFPPNALAMLEGSIEAYGRDKEAISRFLEFVKSSNILPEYSYTADSADQIIRIIWNRMQSNDGLPELQELPDDMRIIDAYGEYAPAPDDLEVSDYEKLGIIRMPRIKQGE